MNLTLFGLITQAGNASLDELQARTSIEPDALAREILSMLREGAITLSSDPSAPREPQTRSATTRSPQLRNLVGQPGDLRLQQLAESDRDDVISMIKAALIDERTAGSILISPTPKGFKLLGR